MTLFAIVQFRNKTKLGSPANIFEVIPTKFLYNFDVTAKVTNNMNTSYMCYYDENFKKNPPKKIGAKSNFVDDEEKNGKFFKVFVIKTFCEYKQFYDKVKCFLFVYFLLFTATLFDAQRHIKSSRIAGRPANLCSSESEKKSVKSSNKRNEKSTNEDESEDKTDDESYFIKNVS